MSRDKVMQCISIIGLIMVAVAIVMPIFNFISDGKPGDVFRYIYAAGALMLLIGRLFTPYRGSNARVKRLCRIEVWAALFLCAAAFFLFYEPRVMRDAIALTLAGAIIQSYVSIMRPIVDK